MRSLLKVAKDAKIKLIHATQGGKVGEKSMFI